MAYHGHNGSFETSWEVAQHADGACIEYNMSHQQYKALIADKPKSADNLTYIMDVINSTYGLKGRVTKLNIER